MLTLHAVPVSLYCAKLRIVLRAKGLTWDEVPPVGGYGSEAYRRLVPSGNLPALVHDGIMIADSEAAAEYLNEVFPDPPLLPDHPAHRAVQRERGRFHDTRLEPELRHLFPFIDGDRAAAPVAAQRAALQARLDQLARMLDAAPPLPFGLGDCALPVTLTWIDALEPVFGLGLTLPHTLRDWRARTEDEPPVAAELASYRRELTGWLARARS